MSRWQPYVTVACVVERAGAFLMVEEDRGGPATLFNQPAGHLEPDEQILDAALREVAEETAWRVGISDYLGMYVYRAPDGKTFHSHAGESDAAVIADRRLGEIDRRVAEQTRDAQRCRLP